MIRSAFPMTMLLAVGLAACAHKTETKTETPPAAKADNDGADKAAKPATVEAARSCTVDTDCLDGELCSQGHCAQITGEMAECGLVRVHFGFNDDVIQVSERPLLERSARCLRRDHKMHVLIDGNADERGTEEYNLALGDRRATHVASYLKDLGVTGPQLQTVSYGKENPLCAEHDEACWAKNRRAAVTLGNDKNKK